MADSDEVIDLISDDDDDAGTGEEVLVPAPLLPAQPPALLQTPAVPVQAASPPPPPLPLQHEEGEHQRLLAESHDGASRRVRLRKAERVFAQWPENSFEEELLEAIKTVRELISREAPFQAEMLLRLGRLGHRERILSGGVQDSSTQLENLLRDELELEVVSIRGDGNCQFRAMSFNLFGTQEFHACLRYLAVASIRAAFGQHRVEDLPWRDSIEEVPTILGIVAQDLKITQDQYLERMKNADGEANLWGDNLTMMAICGTLGLSIDGLQERLHRVSRFRLSKEEPKLRPVFLFYRNSVHYDSLRPWQQASSTDLCGEVEVLGGRFGVETLLQRKIRLGDGPGGGEMYLWMRHHLNRDELELFLGEQHMTDKEAERVGDLLPASNFRVTTITTATPTPTTAAAILPPPTRPSLEPIGTAEEYSAVDYDTQDQKQWIALIKQALKQGQPETLGLTLRFVRLVFHRFLEIIEPSAHPEDHPSGAQLHTGCFQNIRQTLNAALSRMERIDEQRTQGPGPIPVTGYEGVGKTLLISAIIHLLAKVDERPGNITEDAGPRAQDAAQEDQERADPGVCVIRLAMWEPKTTTGAALEVKNWADIREDDDYIDKEHLLQLTWGESDARECALNDIGFKSKKSSPRNGDPMEILPSGPDAATTTMEYVINIDQMAEAHCVEIVYRMEDAIATDLSEVQRARNRFRTAMTTHTRVLAALEELQAAIESKLPVLDLEAAEKAVMKSLDEPFSGYGAAQAHMQVTAKMQNVRAIMQDLQAGPRTSELEDTCLREVQDARRVLEESTENAKNEALAVPLSSDTVHRVAGILGFEPHNYRNAHSSAKFQVDLVKHLALKVPIRFKDLLGTRRTFRSTSLQHIREVLLTHTAGVWSRTGLLESVKITIAGLGELDGIRMPPLLQLLDLPGLAKGNLHMMNFSVNALKRRFPGMLQVFGPRTPPDDINIGMRESGMLNRILDDLSNFFVVSVKPLDKCLDGHSYEGRSKEAVLKDLKDKEKSSEWMTWLTDMAKKHLEDREDQKLSQLEDHEAVAELDKMWTEKTGLKKNEQVGASCLVDVCEAAFTKEQANDWVETRPHQLSALVRVLVESHKAATRRHLRALLAEFAQHCLHPAYNALVSYLELHHTMRKWMSTTKGRNEMQDVFGGVVGRSADLLARVRALAHPTEASIASGSSTQHDLRTLSAQNVSHSFESVFAEVVEPLVVSSQLEGEVEKRIKAAGMLARGSSDILTDMLADDPWGTRLREALLGPVMSLHLAARVAGRLHADAMDALEGTRAELLKILDNVVFSCATTGRAADLVGLARMQLERNAEALFRRYKAVFDTLLSTEAVRSELRENVNFVFRGRMQALAGAMRIGRMNNKNKAGVLAKNGSAIVRTVAQELNVGLREQLNQVLLELANELESLATQVLDRLDVEKLDGGSQVAEVWDHSTDLTVELCAHFRNAFSRALLACACNCDDPDCECHLIQLEQDVRNNMQSHANEQITPPLADPPEEAEPPSPWQRSSQHERPTFDNKEPPPKRVRSNSASPAKASSPVAETLSASAYAKKSRSLLSHNICGNPNLFRDGFLRGHRVLCGAHAVFSWPRRKGPGLCSPCARYFKRHNRMKPAGPTIQTQLQFFRKVGLDYTFPVVEVDPADNEPVSCSKCGQGFNKSHDEPVLVICDGGCGDVFCAPSIREAHDQQGETMDYCCFMEGGSGLPMDGEDWFCSKCMKRRSPEPPGSPPPPPAA